jgi:hypothetical protein
LSSHSIYPKWRQQDPSNEPFVIRRLRINAAAAAS